MRWLVAEASDGISDAQESKVIDMQVEMLADPPLG
jgi:hypothetical protein